jgi:hypothetical protein
MHSQHPHLDHSSRHESTLHVVSLITPGVLNSGEKLLVPERFPRSIPGCTLPTFDHLWKTKSKRLRTEGPQIDTDISQRLFTLSRHQELDGWTSNERGHIALDFWWSQMPPQQQHGLRERESNSCSKTPKHPNKRKSKCTVFVVVTS